MTFILPKYKYNHHGILVPETDAEYPTRKVKVEVAEGNDESTVEEGNKKSRQKNRKRRKKFKVKK